MAKQPPKAEPTNEGTRFDALVVQTSTSDETKVYWHKIGVAFPHADGKGFQIILHALPLEGKIVLRLAEPKSDAGGEY